MLKEKKWYNFGDVNHREHGGRFIKIDGDEIEVVESENNEVNDVHDGVGYMFQYRTESVQELKERFKAYKNGHEDEVGNFADWTMFIDNGWDINEIVMRMAVDMLNYYGCAEQLEFNTNYWIGLSYHGIKPYMFRRT